MSDNVYLISNVHRSGSSMMMRCLEAGGMAADYDDSQEELNTLGSAKGYIPNPNGFYALAEDFQRPDFYEAHEGHVLKYPFRNLLTLVGGKYKLLFLKRNPEEIRLSMQAFAPDRSWGEDELLLDDYDQIVDSIIKLSSYRPDIDVIVLEYADIVKDPVAEFTKLRAAGWEFDIEKAAAMVQPELHRLKLEDK